MRFEGFIDLQGSYLKGDRILICTGDSDVGTSDFSLVLGTMYVCGHAHVRSQVSPGMDCNLQCNERMHSSSTRRSIFKMCSFYLVYRASTRFFIRKMRLKLGKN